MNILNTSDLINPSRLDITSRTILARAILRNWSLSWPFELYKEINDRVHQDNWNELPKQNSFDYLASFIDLISSLKKFGYQEELGVIPLSMGSPANGAHRIAASHCLGLLVPTIEMDVPPEIQNIDFLHSIGVNDIYLDAMVCEYSALIEATRVFVCLGLSDEEFTSIQSTVERYSKLVATKKIVLTEIGKRRLIDLMYSHNEWWQISVLEKFVHERFTMYDTSAHIIVYDSRSCPDITELKKMLRSHLSEGKFDRKIHGSDEHFDTLNITRTIFSDSGMHFLNSAPIGAEDRILKNLSDNHFLMHSESPSVLTGSATLECYGIRDASDIDFISLDESLGNFRPFVRSTQALASLRDDDLILDPRNYFDYKGIRSLSLPALLRFKTDRSEVKDLSDIALVSTFLSYTSSTYLNLKTEKAAFITKKIERRKNSLVAIWIRMPNFVKNLIRKLFLKD